MEDRLGIIYEYCSRTAKLCLSTNAMGTRRCCDVESTSMVLIQRRNKSCAQWEANTRRSPDGGLMLLHRLLRWPNTKPTL